MWIESGSGADRPLVRYWKIATFRKKSWMKMMIHTGKYIYDSAVDESTSTDDEDCHHHGNEVHEEEEYVQQNKILHIC